MTNYDDEMNQLDIPNKLSDVEVISWLQTKEIDWRYLRFFKHYTTLQDDIISDWLNISVRTLRNYRKPENKIKDNVKEQLLLLMTLFRHGNEVFGSSENFYKWLNEENFFFDEKAPVHYLNTNAGIRIVEDRLTAMEYGDNI